MWIFWESLRYDVTEPGVESPKEVLASLTLASRSAKPIFLGHLTGTSTKVSPRS